MTLVELFSAYQEAVAATLGIDCILGYPDTRRNTVTLPVACLVMFDEDYGRLGAGQTPIRRQGQAQPIGRSARVTLYIFAESERALIGLVESFFASKSAPQFKVAGQLVTAFYSTTIRQPFDEIESQLRYAVATEILFNWSF